MRIQEKIINELEDAIVEMGEHVFGPDVTPEMSAYNEGFIDSYTKVSKIIDDYEVNNPVDMSVDQNELSKKQTFEIVTTCLL